MIKIYRSLIMEINIGLWAQIMGKGLSMDMILQVYKTENTMKELDSEVSQNSNNKI